MENENMAANTEVVETTETTTENLANSQTETIDTGIHTHPDPTIKSDVDITQTQAFSQRLKAETQKRIDAEYSALYGAEYGIHSKADYDKAIAQQKQQEEAEKLGVDVDQLKPFFDNWKQSDPDFQELNSIRQEKNVAKALSDLNSELTDIGIDLQLKDLSDEEVAKLPNIDKVTKLVSEGKTLAEAVLLANIKEFYNKKVQSTEKETINKINNNNASSPGSLTGGLSEDNHISFDVYEKNKTDRNWINANYKKIIDSRAKW